MSAYARFAAWTAGALSAGALSAYAVPAQAQTPPRGSYSSTCATMEVSGGYLSGECRTDDGGRRWSSIRYVDCSGDISNRNGVLTCRGATASEGPYYPPQQSGSVEQQIIGAIAGAIFGQVFGGQTGGADLYADGYRYPDYGQAGYGDPRTDPRYGQSGWGYGRDRQWVAIIDRSDWFERRIEAGRRQGRLTDREAETLRADFRALTQVERDFQRGGLTDRERADLGRRFDQLAARIRIDPRGDEWGSGDWRSISSRRTDFETAVSRALAARYVTRNEADRLRRDFDDLVRQESDYSRDGLDRYERQSLAGRYDELLARTGTGTGGGGWTTVEQRAPALTQTIEANRRAGRLSRTDAQRLTDDLNALIRAEDGYERDGLSRSEQEELDRRFNDISQRAGASTGGGATDGPVAARRSELAGGIDNAERLRRITRTEATRLRGELDELVRMEESYASDGLSNAERSYLSSRVDALAALIPWR